jgi:hypothetical protein
LSRFGFYSPIVTVVFNFAKTVYFSAIFATCPITVPPGIAGMQPKLSINYNSNASNGQLGLGFSLSGLSVIHRCAKTIVTDGIKSA